MKLGENTWHAINNLLLKMYSQKSTSLFDNDFMIMLKMLIPYDKASFFRYDHEKDDFLCKPSGIGFGEGVLESKIEMVNNSIPQRWVQYRESSTVLRDSDVFNEEEMKNSKYHMELLVTEKIRYILTILLAHDKMKIGVLTLFREVSNRDFSDEEVYIAEQIMDHMACYAYDLYNIEKYNKNSQRIDVEDVARSYELTYRESELLKFLLKGYSTKQICEELHIAEPTAKKHLSSIYIKTNVKNKSELFALISSNLLKE